jgi:hypothetical protein
MAEKPTEVTPVVPMKGGPPAEVVAMISEPTPKNQEHAPPTSTAEEDRKTAGQRSVNRQWEFWQGFLAVLVIGGFVYTACIQKESPALAGLAGSIVTFYYVRTNHTKIGGVGGTDSR